jgi:minor extracellular serine protease Vpr
MLMKKIFRLLVSAICLPVIVMAQDMVKPKLSAYSKLYLDQYGKAGGKQARIPGHVYKQINGRPYLSAFIKVTPNVDEAAMSSLGVLTGTRAGSVWTVQIPVENFPAFANTAGISNIDLDMPITPLLDSARRQTHADSAQKGINLPMPITGSGVVTGVIDAGFDFNHPTMYDSTGTHYRIKRVWTQKIAGTPPTGFSYGNELTDTNAIKALGYDTAILSHGTHVTGIAAGSGYGSLSNSKFRGMAYESDIVLVGIMPAPSEWTVAGESDIVDGANYIFTYATSVGQPAVVNLSWGSTLGPHDGNSLFSQACDALTGPGKIFVCAAGNNGEDTVHLQKTFTTTDTTVSTFVTFSPSLDSNHQVTWVDVWGDTGMAYCVNIKLYDTSAAIDSTGYVCLADTVRTFYLIGSNHDTCTVVFTETPDEYNGKPHMLISFAGRIHDNICMTTKASAGTVNMWEGYVLPPEGYYGYLKNLGRSWAVSGDVNMTVSDIGCTRSAITVGAYTSKVAFTNISGEGLYYPGASHGRIAPFSSLGTTEDGRIKPDITAPGFALASSVNSHDTSYLTTGTNYSSVISSDTVAGRVYLYAMLAGTSMASPCAAGIVAMMLQVAPSLTPDEAKTIINTTAIHDLYTGAATSTGNTTWGHGKINAYQAIAYILEHESVASLNTQVMDCILYPNPNHGGFTIDYTDNTQEQLTVQVFDIAGRLLSSQYWQVGKGSNSRKFSMTELPKGMYFVRVSSATGFRTVKMNID